MIGVNVKVGAVKVLVKFVFKLQTMASASSSLTV